MLVLVVVGGIVVDVVLVVVVVVLLLVVVVLDVLVVVPGWCGSSTLGLPGAIDLHTKPGIWELGGSETAVQTPSPPGEFAVSFEQFVGEGPHDVAKTPLQVSVAETEGVSVGLRKCGVA